MHPTQSPIKKYVFTIARFVFPFTFDALRLMIMTRIPGLHDANHEDATSPHVAERGSSTRRILPTSGTIVTRIRTRHRCLGRMAQPIMATASMPREIAPEGAVRSMVWNLS